MRAKNNSPYTASVTGGGFLFSETAILLPLLQSEDRAQLLKNEAINNNLLQINSEAARKRVIAEVSKRYDAMPANFWNDYVAMSESDQIAANLFVILKTYKIIFDFHFNVALKRWNSISKSIEKDDIMMEIDEISARDSFVDSWSDETKGKLASTYLTILRKTGLLDEEGQLKPLYCSNPEYYVTLGEPWFLESCLLQPYEIEDIKKRIL